MMDSTQQTTLFGSFVLQSCDNIYQAPPMLYERFMNVVVQKKRGGHSFKGSVKKKARWCRKLSDHERQQFVDDQMNRCEKTKKSAPFDYGFHVRPSAVRGIELNLVNFTMCPITLRLEEGERVFFPRWKMFRLESTCELLRWPLSNTCICGWKT